jgi:hypothetical protein
MGRILLAWEACGKLEHALREAVLVRTPSPELCLEGTL